MQTSLPDLPFHARGIITADTHSSSRSTPRAFPRTDLKQIELWQTFTTDIHTAIRDAMATKGIADGTSIIAGENFRRRPVLVVCEEDIHEVANTELHSAAVDVLRDLGVDGRFYRPGSGEIGTIGDPDFAWVRAGASHPKLVAEYKPNWVADLLDLNASLEAVENGQFTVNDRQCVDALHHIYGYMTFNNVKYGVLSNFLHTWFFQQAEGGGTLYYAGPIDLNTAASSTSILKAFVGTMLLAENNTPHASLTVDSMTSGRLYASTGVTALDGRRKAVEKASNYLAPTEDGAYQCLELDPRLCDFQRNTAKHNERGFVVETNLLHASPTQDFSVVCKAADVFQNQTAVEALEAESRVYLALRHLQGRCIPEVYGYFNIWGILRLLALENVGNIVSDEPISSSLRQKMRATVKQIHDAGYIHGDVARRNFCINNGVVFMIDLEHCQKTQDQTKMRDEMTAADAL